MILSAVVFFIINGVNAMMHGDNSNDQKKLDEAAGRKRRIHQAIHDKIYEFVTSDLKKEDIVQPTNSTIHPYLNWLYSACCIKPITRDEVGRVLINFANGWTKDTGTSPNLNTMLTYKDGKIDSDNFNKDVEIFNLHKHLLTDVLKEFKDDRDAAFIKSLVFEGRQLRF